MSEVTAVIGDRAADADLAARLATEIGPDSDLFRRVETACHAGIEAGWICPHEAGGIRYGRVLKPADALGGYSVDVVHMRDVVGPHHRHPRGEIDMIMPIDAGKPTWPSTVPAATPSRKASGVSPTPCVRSTAGP